MAIASDALVRDKLFIGGEWVEPAGGDSIEVVNPTTEEVIGRIPEGTTEDADRARGACPPVRRHRAEARRARRRARGADHDRDGNADRPVEDDPGRPAGAYVLLDAGAGGRGHVGGGGRELPDR